MSLKNYQEVQQNNFIYKNEMNWYFRLKGENGLLSSLSDEEKINHLIVSYVNPDGMRFFLAFDTYINFIKVMNGINIEKRNFHEVTLESRNQKMRFDLDIKKQYMDEPVTYSMVQNFLDDLVTAIMEEYCEMGIVLSPEKNILVFSSHGKEKWSFHIIIDGYYCENSKECQELFKKITERMNPSSNHMDWLDSGIYSSNHCLRILGSCKKDGDEVRIKKLETSWKFKDSEVKYEYGQEIKSEKHKLVMEFERSFITLTENCYPIPTLISSDTLEGIEKQKKILQLDEEIMDYSYRVFQSTFGDICSYVSTMSNMIMLKRNYPTGCPICDRVHEADNAFLIVKPVHTENECIKKYDIYFDCRRSNGKRMKIGEKVVLDKTTLKSENSPKKEEMVVQKSSRSGFNLRDLEYIAKSSIPISKRGSKSKKYIV